MNKHNWNLKEIQSKFTVGIRICQSGTILSGTVIDNAPANKPDGVIAIEWDNGIVEWNIPGSIHYVWWYHLLLENESEMSDLGYRPLMKLDPGGRGPRGVNRKDLR